MSPQKYTLLFLVACCIIGFWVCMYAIINLRYFSKSYRMLFWLTTSANFLLLLFCVFIPQILFAVIVMLVAYSKTMIPRGEEAHISDIVPYPRSQMYRLLWHLAIFIASLFFVNFLPMLFAHYNYP